VTTTATEGGGGGSKLQLDTSAATLYGIKSNPEQVLQTPNKINLSLKQYQHPMDVANKPEKVHSPFISNKNPMRALFHGNSASGGNNNSNNNSKHNYHEQMSYSVDDIVI
jgi:hypothetical protein